MALDLSCPDWEQRLRDGRSLLPDVIVNPQKADLAVNMFNQIRLPDVPGQPRLLHTAGEWQRDVVRAIFGSERDGTRLIPEVFVMVPKKSNKCLDIDTEVATPTGFKKMSDLRVGDEVLSISGRPTKVLEVSDVFENRPCVEMRFSTGETVICDADHLWVTDALADRQVRPVAERNKPVYSAKSAADIAETLTVSGYGGAVSNHRIAACQPLHLAEGDFIVPPYNYGETLATKAKPVINRRYLRGSFEQRLELLQGVFDAIGTYRQPYHAQATFKNDQVAEFVCELLHTLGYLTHVRQITRRGKVSPTIKFRPFTFANPFRFNESAKRIADAPLITPRSLHRMIVGVKPVKTRPVKCIRVASPGSQFLITRNLIPTHNTTAAAAISLVAMLLNNRPNAKMFCFGPTQAVARTAFDAACGMIKADPVLDAKFYIKNHQSTIEHRQSGAVLAIKSFEMKTLTGQKPSFVILDELHLMSHVKDADRILGQIRGGMISQPEAALLTITTQSDVMPVGIFKDELEYARKVRDGEIKDARILPIIYEFPEAMQLAGAWKKQENWPMVCPNLGLSFSLERMAQEYEAAKERGGDALRRFASQHLNVQMGMGMLDGGWIGGKYWEKQGLPDVDLDELMERCDVCTVGIDGGGLSDLAGMCVIGRDKVTRHWISWHHAWAAPSVLESQKQIADTLRGFADDGDLTLVEQDDLSKDFRDMVEIVMKLERARLLPKEQAVGLDAAGIAELVDMLQLAGLPEEKMTIVQQGYRLSSAIWGCERKLRDGKLWHCGSPMMAWSVSQCKAEARGNSTYIHKSTAGAGKIDPVIAMFNAFTLMAKNPVGQSTPRMVII